MMRIGRHGNLIVVLAPSSALFAQSDVPDVRRILDLSEYEPPLAGAPSTTQALGFRPPG